ncbi:MAG: hypothetical protein OXE86_16040 [Alphaproteobacteria bacterium]|nr:hypothetical protein [Alphaproteobacteria bacterium]
MFEITKYQLLALNDVQLRELVSRLCQAELELQSLPSSAVRWSGSHTAADGGLDVECRLEGRQFTGAYVPRLPTGFQVKKPKMPPSKINQEMRPKGTLRPIFSELAASNGAYIVVSLDDDPTGQPRTQRKTAIRNQISELPDRDLLHTDFYGRAELADWLLQHPSVQIWVRAALGTPLEGWKPFGHWTNPPPDDSDELICRPGLSIIPPGRGAARLSIDQGIQHIRDLLGTSDKALRMLGLSGVGKTRIVQALFEASVGTDPLDESLAIYADLGNDVLPTPRQVIGHLKATGHPAVLVLDNCPAATHNLLAGEISDAADIRLITIEYDIREDKSEHTTVIRVDAEGPDIVEALLSRRYPSFDQGNARTIAKFSDGNARVALALANTVQDNESLSEFSDAQLFDRLFHQRGAPDQHLLAAAQTLALVYSYSVAIDEDGVDELGTLASLIGQSRQAIYAVTQTLLERQLAQQRGDWRAILPTAVANRLATGGLHNIPIHDLRRTFETLSNDRLMKSFGRRLGYLHVDATARQIVQSWLSPGGVLHEIESLNGDRMQLLVNVAPAAPEAVLDTIEERVTQIGTGTFFSQAVTRPDELADLLGMIAYDAALFERCVALLVSLAIAQNREQQTYPDVASRLSSLFALFMSGTEASPDTRESVLRRYLFSTDENERRIGSRMLETALKARDGFSFSLFDFGARPRSFGYEPRSQEDHDQWFHRFIFLCVEAAAHEDAELSVHAREMLANALDLLIFECPALLPALLDAARSLHDRCPWLEGWLAVRSIRHSDDPAADPAADEENSREVGEFLDELDDLLRPTRLADQVRVYVCDAAHGQFSVYDELDHSDEKRIEESQCRLAARAYDLGLSACGYPEVIDELSDELFTGGPGFLADFGKGLAAGCEEPALLWHRLLRGLEAARGMPTHCTILCGVLDAINERDTNLARRILEDSVENSLLRPFLVKLHRSVPPSSESILAFRWALDFDDTPLDQFADPAWQRPPRAFTETLLCDLFSDILNRPHGPKVVLAGLGMRIQISIRSELGIGPELKRLGLAAAAAIFREPKYRHDQSVHRHLPRVLDFCLDESECPEETAATMDAFLARVNSPSAIVSGLRTAATIFVEKLPFRFLNGVCLDPDFEARNRRRLFAEGRSEASILGGLDSSTMIEWCRQGDFQSRLTALSEVIRPFATAEQPDEVVFSAQARAILDAAQDPSPVLNHFANSIRPQGWSGSLAAIIESRCHAFEALLQDDRSHVRSAAQDLVPRIRDWERHERQRESGEDRQLNQRFE